MLIYENLTTKERKKLLSLTDIDYNDPSILLKVHYTVLGAEWASWLLKGNEELKDATLTEVSGGNKDVAKLLITAAERNNGVNRNDFLYRFVFENKNPKEDALQRAMIPDLVKEIRAKTGLSQKRFAEEYDLSVKSVEAWESGSKKITKYAFFYLKNCITEKVGWIKGLKILQLPLNILDEEGKEYLKKCANIDHDYESGYGFSRHIESTPNYGEIYTLEIEDGDIVDGDDTIKIWERDEYPEALQECMNAASKYECGEIWFMKDYNYVWDDFEGSVSDKLEYLLARKD